MPANIICLRRAKLIPVSFHEYFLMIEKDFLTVAHKDSLIWNRLKGNPAFQYFNVVSQELSNER